MKVEIEHSRYVKRDRVFVLINKDLQSHNIVKVPQYNYLNIILFGNKFYFCFWGLGPIEFKN